MKRATVLAIVLTLALCAPLVAQDTEPGLYIILDGSGSMWGQLPDGTHKITAAREVLQSFHVEDYTGRELAFRVYGHRREGDCSDSELVVPFSSPQEAISRMSAFADQVNPTGRTPISLSLRAALEDFGDRPGDIILISDGIETCGEDPCALMREWRDKNINIGVHVVGLGLEEKERLAMSCISEAAGTAYHDAQSVDELIASLESIRQDAIGMNATTEPDSELEGGWHALDIIATNEAGERMRVQGTARWEGAEPIDVSSNGHNRVPAGEVEVTVGVRTRNGNLYEPITASVTVAPTGDTDLQVVVVEPPSVTAKFVELGEERRGSLVTAFAGDEEAFRFRSIDRAYVDPGTYEFRSKPNDDNELAVTETFAAGDHKEILFELVQTVHAKIKIVAAGSGHWFGSNPELWQDGEQAYRVHRRNGVRALPGTYELRLPLKLTPYVYEGLVLTTEAEQEFVIEVPVGHVTISYQNADGSPGRDARVFLSRKNEDDRWIRDGNSATGKLIPLIPGEYQLEGWSQLGDFDTIYFEIAVGEAKEFVLRPKVE